MDYPLYSTNDYLTLTEMRGNAQYIMSYFHDKGWTKNAIAAMLGNMQVESTINPGLWQSKQEFDYGDGFGLVQWTPATKYIDWAATIGADTYELYKTITPQCDRIDWEVINNDTNGQWISDLMTFTEFTQSTQNVRYLSDRFCWGYERPADPDLELRADYGEYWFGLLDYIGLGQKTKSFNWLYMMKKPTIYGG